MATVESKKRANSVYTKSMQDGKHVWDFGAIGKVVCDPDKGSAQARHFLLNYGVGQWVQDGGAKSAGADGKVSAQAKYDGMKARAELIESGVDNLLRQNIAARDTTGDTLLGIMRSKDWTIERVEAWIVKVCAAKGIDRKAVLANAAKNPDVIRAIADIKAERAADSDAQDYLDEMEDETGDETSDEGDLETGAEG